jgi:hypothetical protein
MTRKRLAWEVVTLIWLGGALSLLRVGTREGYAESDALCGPWGCLPPTAALVSMHGFWLMVLLLLSGLSIGLLEPKRLGQVARILISAGILGLVAFVCWSIFSWQQIYGDMSARTFARRFLHLLVTNTDWPVVQCVLAGMVLVIAYRGSHAVEKFSGSSVLGPSAPRLVNDSEDEPR